MESRRTSNARWSMLRIAFVVLAASGCQAIIGLSDYSQGQSGSDAGGNGPQVPQNQGPPSSGGGCTGWAQTGNCSPTGPREPQNDQSCNVPIQTGWSGYCQCSSGNIGTGCGHVQAPCSEICALGSWSGAPPSDGGFGIDAGSSCAPGECLGTDGNCYGPCNEGVCTLDPSAYGAGSCSDPSAGGVSCCLPSQPDSSSGSGSGGSSGGVSSGSSGGYCVTNTSSAVGCPAGNLACNSTRCCPYTTPFHCDATSSCYATASEALAACGGSTCESCNSSSGGSGGSGSGSGSGGSCVPIGQPCPAGTQCCPGGTYGVACASATNGTDYSCAAICYKSSECLSNCCVQLSGASYGACFTSPPPQGCLP